MEEGKLVTDINIQPALDTVSKLSNNRILPYCELSRENDLNIAKIPVQWENQNDKKDSTMRRYITDWIKRQSKKIAAKSAFEKIPMGTSYYTEEKEYRVIACFVITWWERPENEWHSENRE